MRRPLSILIITSQDSSLEAVQREFARLGYAPHYTVVRPESAASELADQSAWDLIVCAGAGCWDLPSRLTEEASSAPPLIYLADAFALTQAFPSNIYVETVDQSLTGFGSAVRRALLYGGERRRRHERETEAAMAQQLHAAVAVSVDEGVLVQDREGRATYANPAAERILGWDSDEIAGRALHDLIHRHPILAQPVAEDCPILVSQRSGIPTEISDDEFYRRDGSAFPASYRIVPVTGPANARDLVIAFRDLSDRRRLEDELLQRTYRDPLTGLPNAALFRERLNQALLLSDMRRGEVAVMFLDIDRFHVINDGLGHTLGDQLLVDISRRLAASLPSGIVLARFGGDQFTILLEGVSRLNEATTIAELLIEELRAPFMLEGREIFITACIGIVLSRADARPGDLLRDADAALHSAKASGRARLAVFNPDRQELSVNRLDLETDLWRALQREEIEVYYQPTVDLRTNAITGYEALSRWRHPHLGLVSPAEFIPLAEEMGLMLTIGRWVLEEACRQTRLWQSEDRSSRRLSVSVNLSAKEFQHPDLPRQVAGALRRTGLAPRWLTLEITEGILMEDAPGTLKTLRALKKLGVRLAIDDFGTGYSSLSYLRRFPVDIVKIDKSLVQPLRNDRRSTAIVRAVTSLAHDLDMTVIAEGIETPLQLACLRDVEADLGQGFIFSPAVDTETMSELLRDGAHMPLRPAEVMGCRQPESPDGSPSSRRRR